jgi:hypothetical protein
VSRPDVGQIRKRVRSAIDAARRASATRREHANAAARAYETFLSERAVPAFRAFANILRAEGIPFEVMTPAAGVRLVSDRSRDDVLEIELDTSLDPPQPLLVTIQTRGSRVLRTERLVKEGSPIDDLTEDDVVELLLEAIKPWLA